MSQIKIFALATIIPTPPPPNNSLFSTSKSRCCCVNYRVTYLKWLCSFSRFWLKADEKPKFSLFDLHSVLLHFFPDYRTLVFKQHAKFTSTWEEVFGPLSNSPGKTLLISLVQRMQHLLLWIHLYVAAIKPLSLSYTQFAMCMVSVLMSCHSYADIIKTFWILLLNLILFQSITTMKPRNCLFRADCNRHQSFCFLSSLPCTVASLYWAG